MQNQFELMHRQTLREIRQQEAAGWKSPEEKRHTFRIGFSLGMLARLKTITPLDTDLLWADIDGLRKIRSA